MGDYSWSKAVWARFDKLGLESPIPEKWLEFEKKSMEKYTAAKEEARKLLDQGKRADAVKLINSAAAEIWSAAVELLR